MVEDIIRNISANIFRTRIGVSIKKKHVSRTKLWYQKESYVTKCNMVNFSKESLDIDKKHLQGLKAIYMSKSWEELRVQDTQCLYASIEVEPKQTKF